MPSYIDLGLPDIPDPQLEPVTWQEMQKVFQAAKNLALALNGGNFTSNVSGSKITIQDYSVVYRTPTIDIPAGSVVQFGYTESNTATGASTFATTIVQTTNLTSLSNPYPIAYTENYVSANILSAFIVLGAVNYPPANLIPGARYYVDYSIAGGISTAGTGRYVGQALDTDMLYFDPQNY